MTLDVLHFIDSKGGNAQEIRDSQKKRGLSVELVDEIVQMYADWVKSTSCYMKILRFSVISCRFVSNNCLYQWITIQIRLARRLMQYRKK